VRSPLECMDGSYEHAVFATYSLNLHFFEQWVLPLLRSVGARNVTILTDEAQLGVALADRSLRSIGRSYHVVSVRLGPGAFHPKLMLLAGDDGARVCISSANLTVDGQLRNVESAIVLDSIVPSHRTPIADTAAFVRAVALDQAPAHTAEAIMAALEAADAIPEERPPGPLRVVHNLVEPLLVHFPAAALTAVTPYADSGEAAGVFAERGGLTVITDGGAFAAPESFFSGAWTVDARDFGKRRLHGKAYWPTVKTDAWLLLGSANLSRQALLGTAAQGNTELGVVLSPHEPQLPEPPGTAWRREALEDTAPRRYAGEEQAESVTAQAGSFDAWEDERIIVVEGVPDEATLDFWHGGAWHRLGAVVGGRVEPPEHVRPYLIRWISDRGTIRHGIVHRTDQLRIHRLRPRSASRGADVLASLPLDLAGVQALESVLRDLYLLGSFVGDDGEDVGRELRERVRDGESEDASGLSTWMPARPEDEPRVPDIYRRRWQNAPDALLALIRGALRLETTLHAPEEEWDVLEESLDFDQADHEAEQESGEGAGRDAPPRVEAPVVTRYRNSLVRLLRRGEEFVRTVADPDLADLGFQSVLALHERIERSPVEVDGHEQTLVESDELLRQKLALLEAYLRVRQGRDPLCLATARAHLASCLAAKKAWTPLEWEQVENLAYRTCAEILQASEFAPAAARDAGEPLREITERLRPYADRSTWDGYLTLADELLSDAEINTEPLICVDGEDWFDRLEASPAWRLIGYGAIVGFAEGQPYAAVVRNSQPRSKVRAHALICEPGKGRLHELFRRASDGAWLARVYAPVNAGVVDDIRKFGLEALLQASATRTPFAEVRDAEGIVDALLTRFASDRPSGAPAMGSPRVEGG
jgi:hypothetical protein